MPLTPLHLGPGLFFWSLFKKNLNFLSLFLASTIMDLEPIILLLINPCYICPHHGIFHSIWAAILGSFLIAIFIYFLRRKIIVFFEKFNIPSNFSFFSLYFSSFFAWNLHIFFDSLTHHDVFIFWPKKFRLLYFGPKIYWELNIIFFVFLIFVSIDFYRYVRHKIHSPKS